MSDTQSAGKPPGACEPGQHECCRGWASALDNILRARAETEALAAKSNQRGEFNSGTGRPLRQCGQQRATLALPLLVLLCLSACEFRKCEERGVYNKWPTLPDSSSRSISPFSCAAVWRDCCRVLSNTWWILPTSGHVTFSDGCFGSISFSLSLKKKL